MNRIGFFVYDKNVYFYPYEAACIQIVKRNFLCRIIALFCEIVHISLPKFVMTKTDFDKVIFTDSGFKKSAYKYYRKKIGVENLILYYMNSINEKNSYLMTYFDNIYTFDIIDSEKFKINYKHTPYSDKIKIEKKNIKFDTLYLGRLKNREIEIKSLKSKLDILNLKNKFMVLDSLNPEMKIEKYISYEEYINYVYESKCIIELLEKGQSGCTLRFLESIFLKKKLITNNFEIVKDPYYKSENVFILGKDDRNLKDFINSEYKDTNENLDALCFENWLKDFN